MPSFSDRAVRGVILTAALSSGLTAQGMFLELPNRAGSGYSVSDDGSEGSPGQDSNGDGDCIDAGEADGAGPFDCDDGMIAINPDAAELCSDGADNDCNPATADGAEEPWLGNACDGTDSDLRTGLPIQMVEIHEAMRLQVLVEARTEVLTAIYQRQPALQQLVGNGWLLLSAKDPDSADIHIFKPQQGWVPWEGERTPLATVDSSMDWYRGQRDHLPPALIRQPGEVQHG